MRKSIIKSRLVALITSIMALSACEKVIDVEIEDAERKFVVEAIITNEAGRPAELRLSKTKSFDESSDFEGYSNAIVTISEINGGSYTLTETAPGIYQSATLIGKPGFRYRLRVEADGNTFTSETQMPEQLVNLENIRFDKLSFFGQQITTVIPEYRDPVGLGNQYQFIQYVNGIRRKAIFVQNDEFSDGLLSTRPLIDGDLELNPGDQVTVDMLCIDPAIYLYWYSLDQSATGENQSATPSNPVSNINGGALGYFSAHSISRKTAIVP